MAKRKWQIGERVCYRGIPGTIGSFQEYKKAGGKSVGNNYKYYIIFDGAPYIDEQTDTIYRAIGTFGQGLTEHEDVVMERLYQRMQQIMEEGE